MSLIRLHSTGSCFWKQCCSYSRLAAGRKFSEKRTDFVITNNLLHLRLELHTTPSLSRDNNLKDDSDISWWRRLMTIVRTFGNGTKQLYYDMMKLKKLYRDKGAMVLTKEAPITNNGRCNVRYSREDLQFMHRTRKDVAKMLPNIILFMIPFFGYFAPLIAFMYPDKLLTRHFFTPSVRNKVIANRNLKVKKNFSELLNKANEGSSGLEFLSSIITQFLTGSPAANTVKLLYHGDIAEVKREYQERLFNGWEITSLTLNRLKKLDAHLLYIYRADWLIKLEGGVKKLSDNEILEACLERGLYFDQSQSDALQKEEMAEKLKKWVAVSTQYKSCPNILLAYLPVAQCR